MARKNVIALLDNQPELGRGFKAQMARRRPVSRSEYRNAQRVTGKKDVDLADARDIRAKGIKAPAAPSRPRRSRKTKTAPPAPKKKVPTPQYPTANARPVDDDPTKAHPRTGGKVGEAPKPRAEFNPDRTPPPLGGFRQKVKVDEHGGVSANETPKPQTKAPVSPPQPKFNAREFAKGAAKDRWANRNMPGTPLRPSESLTLAAGAAGAKGAWNTMFGSGGKGGMHREVIHTGSNAGKRVLERVTPQNLFLKKNPSGAGLSGSQSTNVTRLRKAARKGFKAGKFGTAALGALIDVIGDAKPAY